MSSPAITVTGLGKHYRLGKRPAKSISDAIKGVVRRLRRHEAEEDFWALRDVEFTIPTGQVVGIIGRNGAGKSTLLKVLSRITPPSHGKAIIEGRIASLLEVGTGFHPELSGRDNIYLNGAILGMRRAEIRAKFDEIVAFAEIDRFVDTPVKHYSSGMYVRLAFSVAAHLDPEILIVDEVLAVGDAAFQEKCLGKMNSIARGGDRTILFVSHNTAAVRALCTRALLMESGHLSFDGSVDDALSRYLHHGGNTGAQALSRLQGGSSPHVTFRALLLNGRPHSHQPLDSCLSPITITLDMEVRQSLKASIELRLADSSGTKIALSSPGFDVGSGALHTLRAGLRRLVANIRLPALVSGTYHLDVILVEPYVCYYGIFQQAFELHVEGSGHTWEKLYENSGVDMGWMILPAEVSDKSEELSK